MHQESGLQHLSLSVSKLRVLGSVFFEIRSGLNFDIQWITIWGLINQTSAHPVHYIRTPPKYTTNTHLASSKIVLTSSVFSKSAFKIVGGVALEKPWPTVKQPECLKVLKTCRPSRPVAPVTRTFKDIFPEQL